MIALFSYIYWDVDPTLFTAGPFTVRWYGLLFALGFFVGFLIMRSVYRREGKPEEDLDPLLLYMLAGTIVGARLGHVFFYHPEFYLSHPVEILRIWKGGLASHGGALGILTALYLYSRRHLDQPYLWLLDRMAIPVALAGSLIRLGNVFNSEILGKAADVPWAFIFARIDQVPRHPVQLYESLAYLLIFAGLLLIYKRKGPRVSTGLLSGLFLVAVFAARFFLEFFKVRQASFGGELPLSMGQLLSVPLVFVGGVLVWRAVTSARGSSQDG